MATCMLLRSKTSLAASIRVGCLPPSQAHQHHAGVTPRQETSTSPLLVVSSSHKRHGECFDNAAPHLTWLSHTTSTQSSGSRLVSLSHVETRKLCSTGPFGFDTYVDSLTCSTRGSVVTVETGTVLPAEQRTCVLQYSS